MIILELYGGGHFSFPIMKGEQSKPQVLVHGRQPIQWLMELLVYGGNWSRFDWVNIRQQTREHVENHENEKRCTWEHDPEQLVNYEHQTRGKDRKQT